jgi:hypothetical protein
MNIKQQVGTPVEETGAAAVNNEGNYGIGVVNQNILRAMNQYGVVLLVNQALCCSGNSGHIRIECLW